MNTEDSLTIIPMDMTCDAIGAVTDAIDAWIDIGQIEVEAERPIPSDLAVGLEQLAMAHEIVTRAVRSLARLQAAR